MLLYIFTYSASNMVALCFVTALYQTNNSASAKVGEGVCVLVEWPVTTILLNIFDSFCTLRPTKASSEGNNTSHASKQPEVGMA